MRALLAPALFLLAAKAAACSCIGDGLTLEQRIDASVRVSHVRVVAAELVAESPAQATSALALGPSGEIEYRLIELETLKGDEAPLPKVSGPLWNDGRAVCRGQLQVGEEFVLFVGADENDFEVSNCATWLRRTSGETYPEILIAAIRDYAHERAPIDHCFEMVSRSRDEEARCDALRIELGVRLESRR